MKLTDKVKIVFKNPDNLTKELAITVNQLLDYSKDDLYDILEESEPCNSSSCNNESQSFCDCVTLFEDYEIFEVLVNE
jgi:hypothetical protein